MFSKYLYGWLISSRPKTLLLSASSICMGGSLAFKYSKNFNGLVFSLSLLTAVMLQIFSNLCNDYGDVSKGTDDNSRTGPLRAVHIGLLNLNELKTLIFAQILLTMIFGLIMVILAFGDDWKNTMVFLSLGVVSLIAAYFYTSGKKSYGYVGLGDFFVFIFFGPIAVVGSYYLLTIDFHPAAWLFSSSMGLIGICVLNINNVRDLPSDSAKGKRTIPVRIGLKLAIIYQFTLVILISIIICFGFSEIIPSNSSILSSCIPFIISIVLAIPQFIICVQMWFTPPGKKYNAFLGKFSLTSLLQTLAVATVLLIY